MRCKAGRSWAVGPGEVLEVDPEMGSQLVAFGRHKEAAADVAEVAGMMIGGGAWGTVAGGSVVVATSKTQEALRSLVWF